MKYIDHVNRGLLYARSVVSGKITAGKWTYAACLRQLNDMQRWNRNRASAPYYFDRDAGNRVCEFLETCPHVKGPLAKKKETLKLELWQSFIYSTIYGWKTKNHSRRFQKAYILVGRKNGKTTPSAGLMHYHLSADEEEGPEVYSVATNLDQARISYTIAYTMASKDPEMRDELGIDPGVYITHNPNNNGIMTALCSKDSSIYGKNVSFGLVDELHVHADERVWSAMESSFGSRDQHLLMGITTAGTKVSGIGFTLYQYSCQILNSILLKHDKERKYEVKGDSHLDEEFFTIIYQLDEDDDWKDESKWIKANPNLDVSVSRKTLKAECNKASRMPSAEVEFKAVRCNLWQQSTNPYVPMQRWYDNVTDRPITHYYQQQVALGVDLASREDLACVRMIFRETLDDGPQNKSRTHYYTYGKFYLPEDRLLDTPNLNYAVWAEQGFITLTPGPVIDFEFIERDILEMHKQFSVVGVAYDEMQATYLMSRLSTYKNVNCNIVTQNIYNFSDPMKTIVSMIRDGTLHHDGNPVMTSCVANTAAKYDAKENVYPVKTFKDDPKCKIDGFLALLMAECQWRSFDQDKPIRTPYRPERGVRMVSVG